RRGRRARDRHACIPARPRWAVPGPRRHAAGPVRAARSARARASRVASVHMPAWALWAVAAVALAIGEVLTPGLFFLGPVALAAVAGGVVGALGAGLAWQLVAFIVGSIAGLAVLRPIARAHLHMPALMRTGTAAL